MLALGMAALASAQEPRPPAAEPQRLPPVAAPSASFADEPQSSDNAPVPRAVIVEPMFDHVQSVPLNPVRTPRPANAGALPSLAGDWWNARVISPVLEEEKQWISFDLATLLADALSHSPRILGVGMEAESAWAEVTQEEAVFDARMLVDSRYGRTSDPVGNSLITGGPPLLRESDWTSRVGMRRMTRFGGQWDLSQQFGLLDSNSSFFSPPNQGNARMSISLTQPLLAGAGRLYNERLLLQARLSAGVTWNEVVDEVQANMAELMIAYWQLYYERCRLVQQRDLLQRGIAIERLIEQRADFDTGRIERLRVQEQVARRRDRLVRIETDLRNEQARVALLVGSPVLTDVEIGELIPREHPSCPETQIPVREAIVTGLHHRPDIAIAATEVETAALDLRVTRQQLLPQLNALVDTYVAGLNGNSDIGGSIVDQFTEGQPGFSAGLQLDLPVGRRAARAKHRAAHANLRSKTEALRQAILTARTEIDIAVREMGAAVKSLQMRQDTLEAAVAEERYLQRRWEMLGGDGTTVGLVLEDLLDAQQGRTDAEKDVVAARVEYLQALVRLHVAMGTLLIDQSIEPVFDGAEIGVRFERNANRELDSNEGFHQSTSR